MTPEMKVQLRHLLIKHEGYRQKIYMDSMGIPTIGIGRNLEDRGVLPTEIDLMCEHDMQFFYDKLSEHFPWFNELNNARQIALIDFCFMGFKKFLEFKRMIYFLERHEYDAASHEMLNSSWATQVGERSKCLANIIKTGTIEKNDG